MKKIIAIILVMILVVPNAFATDIFVNDGDISSAGLEASTGISVTSADGSVGKAATDKVMRITKNDSAAYNSLIPVNGFDEITANYYVIEFNYMPKASMDLRIMTDAEAYVAGTIQRGNFFLNKWAKLVVCVDYTEYTSQNRTASATTYYNGTKIGSTYVSSGNNILGKCKADGTTINSFKIHFWNIASGTTGNIADIDDFKMYATDTLPDFTAKTKFTPITSGTLSISNKTATVGYGTTVADLRNEYPKYKFAAYTDAAMGTEIADTTVLNASHTLVAEDENNVMQPCTVVVAGYKTIANGSASEAGLYVSGAQATAGDGTMGKPSSDKVLKMAYNASSATTQLWGNGLTGIGANTQVDKKYIVIKFNYMPKNGTGLSFKTANNKDFVTPVRGEVLNQGKWNSVLAYVDFSRINNNYDYSKLPASWSTATESLTEEELNSLLEFLPVGRIYINGIRYGGDLIASRIIDRYGMCNTISGAVQTGTANVDLRIQPLLPGDKTLFGAEIDDFVMYTTNVKPNGETETALPYIETSNFDLASVIRNTVVVKADATLPLLTANTGTISFVTDESGTAANSFSNAKYAFVASNDRYNVYDISIFDKAVNGDDISVTASNAKTGNIIIVAEYAQSGSLVGSSIFTSESDGILTASYTAIDSGNKIKAFFIDSIGGLMPRIGYMDVK